MARRRKRRTLRPRVPSRVKRRRRSAKKAEVRGHQHPELIGLGLVALGVFLGFVVWAGWNGGYVGGWIGDGLDALVGSATLALPAALVIVGTLMVARSDLVDVRPFRTGLVVLAVGLMITLGKDEGGYFGALLGGGLALAIGSTGVAIAGILTLLVGGLLISGASAGAMLRSSGRAVHRVARRRIPHRPEPRLQVLEGAATLPEPTRPVAPPVDVVNAFPDIVSEAPPRLVPEAEDEPQEASTVISQAAKLNNET